MYLARHRTRGTTQYVIRQSYYDGSFYRSRDLFDLGDHPEKYVVYPGGNAYYIDECVEDALADQGVSCKGDQLEGIFWFFIDPRIRRVIESFSRNASIQNKRIDQAGRKKGLDAHVFDKRRIHYLRFGRMDQGHIGRMPPQLFNVLENKSRDEIEQYFMTSEKILRPHEYKAYVYVIFNLQRHFSAMTAADYPQSLDGRMLDEYFLDNICLLSEDVAFWTGFPRKHGLNEYLTRYVVMFFDHDFGSASQLEDYIKNFMNARRHFRYPSVVKTMGWEEAGRRLEVEKDFLKKMTKHQLTVLYRKKAMTMHPDKGGDPDAFVNLTDAYREVLKRKV